jgi:hypothetical protein
LQNGETSRAGIRKMANAIPEIVIRRLGTDRPANYRLAPRLELRNRAIFLDRGSTRVCARDNSRNCSGFSGVTEI